MITIDGNTAEVRFPWPTNDTGRNNAVVKAMATQVSSAVAAQGRQLVGAARFHNLARTETGFEFVFTANLVPLEETNG